MSALPANEDLSLCGDCGKRAGHGTIMHILRKPNGWWAICGGCWVKAKREADAEALARDRKLADKEKRQTHRKARVGSHG